MINLTNNQIKAFNFLYDFIRNNPKELFIDNYIGQYQIIIIISKFKLHKLYRRYFYIKKDKIECVVYKANKKTKTYMQKLKKR